MKKRLPILFLLLLMAGCTRHNVQVAPIEVKPIHITIDVNVKVDRALDDFFGDIDASATKLEKQKTTRP